MWKSSSTDVEHIEYIETFEKIGEFNGQPIMYIGRVHGIDAVVVGDYQSAVDLPEGTPFATCQLFYGAGYIYSGDLMQAGKNATWLTSPSTLKDSTTP
jgi:hypothetical protein